MGAGAVFASLAQGFGTSLLIFCGTLIFALPLGLAICFGEMSRFKPISFLFRGLVWVIRGTPLLLQIIVIFYVPALLGFDLSIVINGVTFNILSDQGLRTVFVILAFIINYAAYFAEIYRGGIQSISKGQYEASQLLGLSKGQSFKSIIFPQVYRRILAPMSNEIITLVKDTSLARVIGVMEIIMVAEGVMNASGDVWPLLATGIFYLIFNGMLTILFSRMEKRVSYFK